MSEFVRGIREVLEEKVESKRKELESVRKKHLMQHKCTLSTDLDTKIKELETHKQKWFQGFRQTKTDRLQNEIDSLEQKIKEKNKEKELQAKKEIEDIEKEIKKNEKLLQDYCPQDVWEGYPDVLNTKVVEEYVEMFKDLIHPISPEEPYINIVMIGETGAGKSSFLNTFATALSQKKHLKDVYRISPKQTKDKEKSATKRIHLEPLYLGDEKQHLHIRFYDIPGIGEKNNVGKDELDMMIDGKLNTDVELKNAVEMKQNPKNFRDHPTSADKANCILYVLRATSNLSINMSNSLKIMHEIRQCRSREDDVRQFVIVTSIDEFGVPKNDIKHAYKYGCILKICKKISEILDIDLPHVIPVSNYADEAAPTTAKNAMSLMAMWRICESSKEFILRKKKETCANFRT